jgi:hypothetical protein
MLVSEALKARGLPKEALLSTPILGKSIEEEAVTTQQLIRGPYGTRKFGGTISVIVVASEGQADSANTLFGYSLSNCTGIAVQYNVSVCTNGHVGPTVKPKKISEKDKAQEAMHLIRHFLGNKTSGTWLRFVNKNLFCNGSRVVKSLGIKAGHKVNKSMRATKKNTFAKTLTDLVQKEELQRIMKKPHFYWYVLGSCLLVPVLCLVTAFTVPGLPNLIAKGEWPKKSGSGGEKGDGGYEIGKIEDDDEDGTWDK